MPLDPADRVKKKSVRRQTFPASFVFEGSAVSLADAVNAGVIAIGPKSAANESLFLDHFEGVVGPAQSPINQENTYGMIWLSPDDALIGPITSMTMKQVIENAVWVTKQRWRTIGAGTATVDVYKDIEDDFDPSDDRANNTTKGQNPDDHLTLCLFGASDVGIGTQIGFAGELAYRRRRFLRLFRDGDEWDGMSFEEQVAGWTT